MSETPLQAVAGELAKTADAVTIHEPMARHTTFKIGGPADVFAVVRTTEQLVHAVNICRESQAPFFLLGGGSNILVSDRGVRGVVIRNKSSGLSMDNAPDDTPDSRTVRVDSGYPMPKFAVDIGRYGLTGCEFLQSIPGTIGGGARQNVRFRNASQFDRYGGLRETRETDCYLGDFVTDVEVLTERGERKALANRECGFTYTGITARGFENNSPIITRLRLKLQRGSPGAVRKRLQQYRAWRAHRWATLSNAKVAQPEDGFTGTRARQPIGATAGCVFFNIPNEHNHPTGRLIDLCGLKGCRMGNAEISAAHANYIVNLGGAKAVDVRALMELAKEKVFARFGVELVEEVQLVGEW
uniref:UDP-N-acetylenolpyruvoylglucosamine reductase n=1 Tax=Candidatus Kentrum eta TaxID=2126337 RepID=A0A450VDA8_9GAMM|nr:MAG: UDP-N-acetylmuramate dehydrogenase [Candidatus Kentron sp. H]VFJ97027.1 MAG: UDP-N-acetylmuramate dehydrogenase [Candidatus Kentron sp. H]VFK02766.1 MAG: UDP-N-acetylmuramate dehydrogenase [Candidatus Kentron sp. H]